MTTSKNQDSEQALAATQIKNYEEFWEFEFFKGRELKKQNSKQFVFISSHPFQSRQFCQSPLNHSQMKNHRSLGGKGPRQFTGHLK